MSSQVMRLDQINLALIVVCVGLAYLLPFELVLLSYAILGPAHYLTQINWLHERRYFVAQSGFLGYGIGLTVLAVLVPSMFAAALLAAVVLAILYLANVKSSWAILTSAAVLVGYQLFLKELTITNLLLAVLLPTVIHVYVFTFLFMLLGALKSQSSWGLMAALAMPLAGVLFFAFPPSGLIWNTQFVQSNSNLFQHVIEQLLQVLQINSSATLIASGMGFLSFAYTYHYLNWFSKVELIRWHQVSIKRWVIMALIYFSALGIYFYDYRLGFSVLLFLSLLHVVLEFPLNGSSLRELTRMMNPVKA